MRSATSPNADFSIVQAAARPSRKERYPGHEPQAESSNAIVTTRLTSQSDLEALARSGDGHAFGQLIRQWDDDLRGIVWSVLRSASETDDVMQTAYEKAFRSIANFRQDASMKTWLYSICLRSAIDHSRYERRRRHESTAMLTHMASDVSTSRAALSKGELAAVLDTIDPEARGLLMLTVGLGYSFDEAAEIADLPRGTVASRVARAKQAIRSTRHATRAASTAGRHDSEETA